MIKREEIANPDSCLSRAADDEPVFVLRANDPRAAHVVRYWAAEYLHEKGGFARMTDAQVAKYNEALKLASEMTGWQRRKEGPKR